MLGGSAWRQELSGSDDPKAKQPAAQVRTRCMHSGAPWRRAGSSLRTVPLDTCIWLVLELAEATITGGVPCHSPTPAHPEPIPGPAKSARAVPGRACSHCSRSC